MCLTEFALLKSLLRRARQVAQHGQHWAGAHGQPRPCHQQLLRRHHRRRRPHRRRWELYKSGQRWEALPQMQQTASQEQRQVLDIPAAMSTAQGFCAIASY